MSRATRRRFGARARTHKSGSVSAARRMSALNFNSDRFHCVAANAAMCQTQTNSAWTGSRSWTQMCRGHYTQLGNGVSRKATANSSLIASSERLRLRSAALELTNIFVAVLLFRHWRPDKSHGARRPISPRSPWQNPYHMLSAHWDTTARVLRSRPDLWRTAFATRPDFVSALLQ